MSDHDATVDSRMKGSKEEELCGSLKKKEKKKKKANRHTDNSGTLIERRFRGTPLVQTTPHLSN